MPRLLCIFACLVSCLGCPGVKSTVSTPQRIVSEADRPALRVRITGNNDLIDAISRRWKSISDQNLDIQAVDSNDLLSAERIKTDILIAESRWLPTLVERRWIVTLPKQIAGAITNASTDRNQHSEWPLVWKQSATYGQRMWGLPLGVPLMTFIEVPNDQNISSGPWIERIVEAESPLSKSNLTGQIQTANFDDFLLDRFLIFATSLNPRATDSGFLFNLNNARSRLGEAWLSDAAALFGKLYRGKIELANMQPDKAWESVADKSAGWALAWPASRSESAQVVQVQSLTTWVDSGRGLVAAFTTMNRQTAVSIRFIHWLNEDIQRQEFSKYSAAIQPLPEYWLSKGEQIDINRYQEIMKRAFDDRFAVHELRFAESPPYRQSLTAALRRILKAPETAEAELQKCEAHWDELTAKIGQEIQKKRFKLSLELEAYRE